MKTYGEWMYSSTILDLGTTWWWMVSFRLQLLYPWLNSPQYPLHRRLGGLSGETEYNHEKHQSSQLVSWPRFEPSTFWPCVTSTRATHQLTWSEHKFLQYVIHLTATLKYMVLVSQCPTFIWLYHSILLHIVY
jgi:hypothetical protein